MKQCLVKTALLTVGLSLASAPVVVALPSPAPKPETDIPEEVLRNQVITGARSPIDGRPLTASEYVHLKNQIQTPPTQPGQVAENVKDLIGLLRLRKVIKTIIPFFPIK